MLTTIEQGAKSPTQLAKATNMHPRAIGLLLEVLEAVGVLSKADAPSEEGEDAYQLTTLSQILLNSEYRELGNQYWRFLPTYLKTGQPFKRMDDLSESEAHYQVQAGMLGWMLMAAAAEAAQRLDIGGSRRGLKILDVGAGSAIWSLSMAQRDADVRVTANDWPAVLDVARQTANSLGVAGQLDVLNGDFHLVDFPAGAFDLVIVANVVHLQTADRNRALFRRLRPAMKAGGEMMVVDALADAGDDRISTALYHLGLSLRTEHGRVYSSRDIREMLGDEFEPPQLIRLKSPPRVGGILLVRAK
ncbi:MAG: class I SAM-dependent methyltransferase [Pirellulales bacterium]